MGRILYLIDHDNFGGAQRIVEGIVQNSDNIQVFALRTKKDENSKVFFSKEKWFSSPAENIFTYIWNILKLPFLIKNSDIEIVHCQLLGSWLCGLWISLFFSKKKYPLFIFHEHSSIVLPYSLQKILLHFTHKRGVLFSVSDAIRKDMAGYGIPEKDIIVLKNFIDLKKFYPRTYSEEDQVKIGIDHNWINGRTIAGSAIRLVGYKNWRLLIEVAKELSNEPICFLISGDGEDKLIVQNMIMENHLENNVKLIGMQKEMPIFYNSLDIFLFPSLKESFGIVLVEAQSCGVPVIAMAIPALQEIAENDSAILVPTDNVEVFTSEILRLMRNESYYHRLKEAGLENAKHYDLQHYLDQLQDIYQRLLKVQFHQ